MNTASATAPSSLEPIIAGIARALSSRAVGSGDLAELRRLDVHAPDKPAFWRIVAAYVDPGRQTAGFSLAAESAWAIVLSNMARMAPSPHDPRRSVGRALAEAGFHELRLMRLLRTHGHGFSDVVRRACGFLAARGDAVNWVELAALILTTDRDRAEAIRRRIARDYYNYYTVTP